jgi:hypothetical protein
MNADENQDENAEVNEEVNAENNPQARTREMARLCEQVLADPQEEDKLSLEKRLKQEVAQMRSLAQRVEAKPGHLVCEGVHGRAVADQKETTLFHTETGKPLRWVPFKSHLYAVHAALCWAVLGVSTKHW